MRTAGGGESRRVNLAAVGTIVGARCVRSVGGSPVSADPGGARLTPGGPKEVAEPEGIDIGSATAEGTVWMSYEGASAWIVLGEGYAGRVQATQYGFEPVKWLGSSGMVLTFLVTGRIGDMASGERGGALLPPSLNSGACGARSQRRSHSELCKLSL